LRNVKKFCEKHSRDEVAATWLLRALSASDDRAAFSSSSAPLNRYFHEQVTQDVRRRVATCFIAGDESDVVAGFYTHASGSVMLTNLPAATIKKLPRYPTAPVVRMERLAVSTTHAGKGLGGALLADAVMRAARAEVAAYALLVDAKDDAARAFYAHHGFIGLPETPLTLFLPFSALS
jgi:GNAT superfamily N-acetyltransferase